LSRGLTQAALARQIGVSRQFLNQMEAGRVLPNVVIALRLALVLGSTVEDLFGATAPAVDIVSVTPAAPGIAPGARLWLGRIGRTWIAHPADTVGSLAAGFTPADAVLEVPGRARWLVPPAAAADNLLVAGCDPALALLQPLSGLGAGGRCHWLDCGSGRALDLLAAGSVHVAGIHYAGTEGSGNLHELRRRDPKQQWRLIRFTRWEQGWMLRRGMGQRFSGIAGLGKGKWHLANRDESTAARRWLDRELARAKIEPVGIPGYSTPVPSAAEGARAVADGRADVTVGPQALALAHRLEFVPAEAVDFDLVAPTSWWQGAAGRGLRERIGELATDGGLASLPGYAKTQSGLERSRARVRRQTG
jgi:molybdate-binding protein/DNA-binding XRE family transcriptional regulator